MEIHIARIERELEAMRLKGLVDDPAKFAAWSEILQALRKLNDAFRQSIH